MRLCRVFGAVLAIGVAAAPSWGAELDQKVVGLVKKASDLFVNAKSVQAEMQIKSTLKEGPFKNLSYSTTYAVASPNKLKFTLRNDNDPKGGLDMFSNGESLAAYALRYNEYVQHDPPSDYIGLGEQIHRLGHHHTGMLFHNMLNDDPAKILLNDVETCEHAGMEKVGEVETHHLKFMQPNLTWELWIDAGEKPFVWQVRADIENGKLVTLETYKDWKIDEEIPADRFAFVAPKDAKQVEQLQLRKPEDMPK